MQTLSFYLCHNTPANSMGPMDRSDDAFLARMYKVASTAACQRCVHGAGGESRLSKDATWSGKCILPLAA